MQRISFPTDALQRIRLAFLALGGLAIVLAGVQIALGLDGGPGHSTMAALGLVAIGAVWSHHYLRGSSTWWGDLIVSGALFLFLTLLALPDLGLGLVYMTLYLGVLFGSRWDSARSLGLILVAYLGAELEAGLLQSPILMQFVGLQTPALIVTGIIMRVLHEALVSRRRLTEEIEKMIRMEAVTRLTAGIAHDFNNLLMAIRGTIELARAEIDEGEEAHEDLSVALRTTERASALTRQLLTFSRAQITHPELVDLNAQVVEMEPMLERLVGGSIDLRMRLNDGAGAVLIDPTSLEQVVTNLVINAKEALEEDGAEDHRGKRDSWILVRTYSTRTRSVARRLDRVPESDRLAVLEVRDSGPGISLDVQDKVLEPFFTTKGSGTGLGLSTVYGIVSQANGQLQIDSTPGEGTRISIYLPLSGDG